MVVINDMNKQGKFQVDLYSWEFENRRVIRLAGQVTDSLADEIIAKLEYLADKSGEPIKLYINSPGGSVTAGLAIYDTMKRIKCDVSTICVGMAASMGAFLLAGGTKGKRYITENAEVMIHQPLGGAYGQSTDVTLVAEHLSNVKKKLNAIMASNTGKSIKQIAIDTDRDHYLDAKEAVEYGLVDKVI